MKTQKNRSEFGFVPGESDFPSSPPEERVTDPEFNGPAGGLAAPEYGTPAPEITGPGEYIYEERSKSKRSAVKLMAILAALSLMIGATGPFSGTGEKGSPAEESKQETAESSGTEDSKSETSSAETSTAADSSAGTESSTAEGTVQEESSEPVVYVEPQCDIVVVGMASEISGAVLFSDLDDTLTIHIEIWDPQTDYLFQSFDILPSELVDGRFTLPAFTTDHFYDANQAYYDASGEFPFDTEVRVRIAYGPEDDPLIKEFSQMSVQEDSMWWSYYNEATDPAWGSPQSYYFLGPESTERVTVVIGHPELVTKKGDVISLRLVVDGAEVPEEDFDIQYSEYEGEMYDMDGNLVYTGVIYNVTVVIPYPFSSGVQHESTLYVTHYLSGYDRIWTSEVEMGYYSSGPTG